MFSQKKRRNYTWIYVTLIVLLLLVAMFIIIGAFNSSGEENLAPTNSSDQVKENENADDAKTPGEENSPSEKVYQSYYLVKYDNNVIKIYFSDEKGKLTLLEESTIIYDILSPDDQQRFKDGIRLDSRDDLNRLIMDYES